MQKHSLWGLVLLSIEHRVGYPKQRCSLYGSTVGHDSAACVRSRAKAVDLPACFHDASGTCCIHFEENGNMLIIIIIKLPN
jgi:hypothetical protein